MAYFSDSNWLARKKWLLRSAKGAPFCFLTEHKGLVIFDKNLDTLKMLSGEYLYCRCNCDLCPVEHFNHSDTEAETVTLPEHTGRVLTIDLSQN